MTKQEKLNLVTNYFAEDWAIEKAMILLEDYEKMLEAPQPSPAPGDPLEVHWKAAMADPAEVPGYLQEIAASRAQAADSVLEDAARLDFLATAPEGCVRMDSIGGLCPSYIYWGTSDYYSNAGRNDAGNFIGPTPRAAIDAARKQGASHD